MVQGDGRKYSEEFRKEVCDYYFEHKDEDGITLLKIGMIFGLPVANASGQLSKWLMEDPRYVPRRKSVSEEEKIAALTFYHDTPGVLIADVMAKFGFPSNPHVFRRWVRERPQYKKFRGYTEEQIADICNYALEHSDMMLKEVIAEFGYPAHTHTLSIWLESYYGVPRKRKTKRFLSDEEVKRGVEYAFANPDKPICDVELDLGFPNDSIMVRIREDPRWESDLRNRKALQAKKQEIVDYYFDNPSMSMKDVSEHFGGRPCPSQVTKWAKEDPRFLDPAAYGYTEEQKRRALDLHFSQPDIKMRDLEKTLGFPLNKRAWRCWVSADPRRKLGGKRGAWRDVTFLELRSDVALAVRVDGLAIEDAADRYNVSKDSVKRYLKLYDEGGLVALMSDKDIPKRGNSLQATKRPMSAKVDALTDKEVREIIRRNEELEKRNEELQFENDVCHAIFDVLKKDPSLSEGELLTTREKTLIINALRPKYKLRVLLERFEMPKSTYEYNRNAILRPDKYELIRAFIRDAFEKSGHAYGYRRITAVLRLPVLEKDKKGISGYGIVVDEKVVRRLMKEEGIVTLPAMRLLRYNSYRGSVGKVAPNLLNRDFSSDAPYKKLLTDVTEFHLNNYKVYLSPVIDCFNGEIISWTISQSPSLEFVTTMLKNAIRRVGRGFGVVIHSDQGWAYQHALYRQMLIDAGWQQSMSRKGCCSDNSAMEGFFGRLKNEFFYNHDFTGYTPDEFMGALNDWIVWHNEFRIKEGLGYTSPVLYREQWEQEHTELALAA